VPDAALDTATTPSARSAPAAEGCCWGSLALPRSDGAGSVSLQLGYGLGRLKGASRLVLLVLVEHFVQSFFDREDRFQAVPQHS